MDVIGGQCRSDAGYLRGHVWELGDAHETVAASPYGHEVLLDQETAIPAPVIAAFLRAFLRVVADDLTWPRCGTLNYVGVFLGVLRLDERPTAHRACRCGDVPDPAACRVLLCQR